MMKITRLTELSLYYKIKDTLSIKRTGEVLKSVDFLSYSLKYNNIPTAFEVVVKVDGTVATSGYAVDYINGLIKFISPLTASNTVTADYYFCPFNIYDEGSNESTDNLKYPAIGIYEDNADAIPFELGSSNTEKIKEFVIEVWSERGGERTDAVDTLVEMLEGNIPIINYNDGFPYNTDGTINMSFDPTNIVAIATTDSINYSKGGSLDIGNKPKYFSEIRVDLKILT
jgi:hypothetical protein